MIGLSYERSISDSSPQLSNTWAGCDRDPRIVLIITYFSNSYYKSFHSIIIQTPSLQLVRLL